MVLFFLQPSQVGEDLLTITKGEVLLHERIITKEYEMYIKNFKKLTKLTIKG